ncbi:MAG: hypothetical protein F4Y82_03830 [Cenarchaeum sp. SB0665_bin_23]|nr:hypothetical protein [Cenarchaeum sp. SB0667_bin_13]MXY61231.1 hypothetical protein [Cenarchaeum sp. SB0665_bin_23]MXZ93884.1 hypothetical protein [Cenarchaeum sp. SB0666_bin_15]MYB46140.1 hypothetical protein [Cenarchaeum sp. SB0662_bin_33]MYC79135.1 hypothetical protein [Cenarchaeum sp. SB0661_bin_35]MYD59147.1 hypothetical protein [Cenarchaeum sp. SB0678_bin_8]MYG33822.1 hypothetical protein [Cenarchaeum sp. SB0677_bin_16]MYI51385.1 hypothetical protein [Cenarchaeum sp. SB0673_bin_9]M
MKKYAITLTVLMLLLAPLVIYTQTLAGDEQSGPVGNDEQSGPSNTGAGDNSTSATALGDGDDTPSIGTGAVDDRN